MLHRSAAFCAALLVTLTVTLWTPDAAAQVIHLPPYYRRTLPKGTVLLSLKLKQPTKVNNAGASTPPDQQIDAGATPAPASAGHLAGAPDVPADSSVGNVSISGVSVAIQDDQLVITHPDKAPDIIVLSDRDIRDVVAEIRSKDGDLLEVTSDHLLSKASMLQSTLGAKKIVADSLFEFTASSNEPEIKVGFGFILALSDNSDKQQQGLLSQAGFQLDIVGVHELLGPGRAESDKQPGWRPLLVVQTRLGLNANQQLNVQTEAGTAVADQMANQFETALQQADQVAVASQFDVVLPLWDRHTDFILTPLYGVSWTRLDPFTPPAALTSAAQKDTAALASDKLDQAIADMGRTLPLSEFGLTALFQFRHDGAPLFFFGGGFSWREDVRRTFTYDTLTDGEPDVSSIKGDLSTPMVHYWTAQFGARLAGIMDVRLDAAGPIGKRNGQPLLRVILGRSFPIAQ